ncbi:MAG: nickel-responsive transcriptional regulator NikR [Myxococcota bacterium]|nr:nickel-responsive transcriptional regulator NikR [Myxococcota bacterium]
MSDLSRFGVAMETSLLAQFDQLVRERKSSRSEVLRDLARAEIMLSLSRKRVDAFASVTIVYSHHVRELSEKITEMQHQLGDQVRSTMHVHLDRHRCLEVIVMRGRADKLQLAAERLFATRGILQGSIEIVAATESADARQAGEHRHNHADQAHTASQGQPKRPRLRRAV